MSRSHGFCAVSKLCTSKLRQLVACAAIDVYACIRKASLRHMPIDTEADATEMRDLQSRHPNECSQARLKTTNNSVTNTTHPTPILPRSPLAGRKSPHTPRRAELPKQLPQKPAGRTGPGTRQHPRRILEPRDPPALASHPPTLRLS